MVEMLQEQEYQLIAEKLIYKLCTNNIAKYIIADNDFFGSIVTEIMRADWEWNGKGTIYGYRKQRVKWALSRIIKEISNIKRGKYKINTFSAFSYDDFMIIDKQQEQNNFVNDIDNADYTEYIQEKITQSTILTDNEKQVLISRFINKKTIREIAEQFNIRGEAIRQTLARSIKKIGKSLCVS